MQNTCGENHSKDNNLGFKAYFLCRQIGAGEYSFVWHFQLLGTGVHHSTSSSGSGQEVIQKLSLGGGSDYKKAPYVAWDTICQPKKKGGVGIRNLMCGIMDVLQS